MRNWSLDSAIKFVQEIQLGCRERGFDIALRGDVLMGEERPDGLDLAAIARTEKSMPHNLHEFLFEKLGEFPDTSMVKGFSYWTFYRNEIEVLIVEHPDS